MAVFSVILLTAAPTTMGAEAGGAFVKIDGREALIRSAELFLNREPIKQIQVVFLPEVIEEAKRKHGGHFGFSGIKVTGGGPRWIDQIVAGAEKLNPEATHVIVHDAARPAVAYSDIDALLEASEKHAAVTLATPVRAPLIELDEGGQPMAFHAPTHFMQMLTPQVFSVAKLKEMVASKQELHASQFTIIKGSPLNLRVSGSGDAGLVKNMINMLPKPKIKPPSSPFEEAQW
jgi:2-C-methyl-D-erythritol 4-phosphate cytidylyltransferase